MKQIFDPWTIQAPSFSLSWRSWITRAFLPIILVLCLLGGGKIAAQSNVVVDRVSGPVSPSSGTTVTVSHQTGTQTDRIMLVGISTRDRTISSVTYGGSPLALLTSQTASKEARTYIYYLLNPPSGTANVVVTINTGATADRRAIVGVITFANVDVTNFVAQANAATAGGTNSNPTVNVTSSSGRLVFAVATARAQNFTLLGGGQTERWLLNGQTPRGAASTEPGAATTTMSYSLAANTNWSISAVSIKDRYLSADLSVDKSVNTGSALLGNNVTFTITASNPLGPNNATGVSVTDILPDGYSIVSATPSTGSWTAPTWTIGNLNTGASETLTIVAKVECGNNYVNTATIGGNEPDPNPSNNSDVVSVTPLNLIPTSYSLCPGSTFDLTSLVPCNNPPGTNVTWHQSSEATSGNKVPNPAAVGAGTYYIAFEDAVNSCYSPTQAFTVSYFPQITASMSAAQNPLLCHGTTTTLTVTASGGTGSLEYSLNGGGYQSSNVFTVGAGTYTATVRDGSPSPGPCSVTTNTVVITEPTALGITVISRTHVNCYGQSTGSISVTGNGGTPPYTYSIDGTNYVASGTFTGLTANTYTLYVKDNNNCGPVTTSVTLTQPAAALSLTPSPLITQPTCFSSGSIDLSVTGGTPPYTYDWADLAGTGNPADRTGLMAGNYSVTVYDANLCSVASGTLTLDTPSGCAGVTVCRSDAASVFSVTPDPENTSYTWSIESLPLPGTDYSGAIMSGQGTPSVTIDWTGIPAGDYTLCVVAHNVCGTSTETCQTVYVTEPAASASSGPACEGGTLQLFGSGGVSYTWAGPGGFTSSSANPVLYGVAQAGNGGTYSLTVTDAGGCKASTSVSVTIQPNPSVTVTVTDAGCGQANGAADITPSGGTTGYTYMWNTGAVSQDLTNIYSGNYSVTVTDNAGCKVTATASVLDLGGPAVAGTVTNVSCYGDNDGAVDITVSQSPAHPPYSYLWSNGATSEDLGGLTAGTYSVVVTDNLGCKGAASFTVTQPNPLSLDETHVHVLCYGNSTGSIDLIVSGGTPAYNYSWTKDGNPYGGNTQDLSNLGYGTYAVTVTDANLCTALLSIPIIQPAAALSATPAISHVSCSGGSDGQIVLSVTGGTAPYAYLWSNSATTKDLTGLTAGSYSVTVTDAGSCTLILSNISVNEPADLTADASAKTDVSCFGGSDGTITLSVGGGTGPFSYLWSNGAITQNLSGLPAGTYSVTVTDSEGCTETASNTITQPALLTASAVPADADCYGAGTGSVDLTVSGGTLLPGGPPNYLYLWSNAATTEDLAGVAAGSYTVTVTDDKGCTAQAGAVVSQPSAITVSAAVTNVLCNGAATGAIDLTAGGGAGGFTYAWADGPSTEDRNGLSAGTYTVTVTDANLCTESRSYTITQPSVIAPSMLNTNISCFGGSDGTINLSVSGGTGPYTFLWSNGATTEDLSGLSAGAYTVTVTDIHLCTTVMTSADITQPTQLLLGSAKTDVTCKGGSDGSVSSTPSQGTPPYAYSWSTSAITQNISGLPAGTYALTVTDALGCTATTSQIVTEPSVEIELYATAQDASACGGNTGSIDLTVVNGNLPFTFTWTGPTAIGNVEDPTGLAAGNYAVTVTDATLCSEVLGITLGTSPALLVTVNAYNRTCLAADGSVVASVSGGNPPYSYSWTGGYTTQAVYNLDAGTYTVTVTDANSCTATASGTINVPGCIPPVAITDYYSTPYLTPVSGTVVTNDYDTDQVLELEWIPLTIPTPEQGTILWDPSDNGGFTYTPAEGFWGTFFVVYQLCDSTYLCDTAKLVITVGTRADLSITKSASPDPALTGQTLTYTVVVTNNGPTAALDVSVTDTPADFPSPSYSLTGLPPWSDWTGSLSIGTLPPSQTYTIYIQDTLAITECLSISNSAGVSTSSVDPDPGNNSTLLNTTVTNQAPVAVDDEYTMAQNLAGLPSSLTANVLANDSDAEGHPLTVTAWGAPSPSGSLTTGANGTFTFVPAVGFTGDVTFTYTVCDSCDQCDTATVTIHILTCILEPAVPGPVNKN